jgi:hypothetical protein
MPPRFAGNTFTCHICCPPTTTGATRGLRPLPVNAAVDHVMAADVHRRRRCGIRRSDWTTVRHRRVRRCNLPVRRRGRWWDHRQSPVRRDRKTTPMTCATARRRSPHRCFRYFLPRRYRYRRRRRRRRRTARTDTATMTKTTCNCPTCAASATEDHRRRAACRRRTPTRCRNCSTSRWGAPAAAADRPSSSCGDHRVMRADEAFVRRSRTASAIATHRTAAGASSGAFQTATATSALRRRPTVRPCKASAAASDDRLNCRRLSSTDGPSEWLRRIIR